MTDRDQQDEQAYGPQQPCPACGEPMGGLGWRISQHECTNPMACPHSEHWLGAWGDCHHGCPTEQVANNARAEGERAATERICKRIEQEQDDFNGYDFRSDDTGAELASDVVETFARGLIADIREGRA